MSKVAGLPQMKVGWIAEFGPHAEQQRAAARLDVIADTFLSMNTPTQIALPAWLGGRHEILQQILYRIAANIASIKSYGIEMLRLEAGWSAILRLPKVGLDAERLLHLTKVVVHPGSLYGMSEEGRIVVSLIVPAEVFSIGVSQDSRESS